METNLDSTGSKTMTVSLTREEKITGDIQAAGQMANSLCPAYQ